jgi:SAM-dependent methyltransferase
MGQIYSAVRLWDGTESRFNELFCGENRENLCYFEFMQRDLATVRNDWELLARLDPKWAILTEPSKVDGAWESSQFFDSGRREVEQVICLLREVAPDRTAERALDFGCGLGRLSRALSAYYTRVDGIDIAPSMIAQAQELNIGYDRCFFSVNERSDLKLFPRNAFDLIYTNFVLQHMPAMLAEGYLREFVRCARPDGLIIFQTVARRRLTIGSVNQVLQYALYPFVPAWFLRAYRLRKSKGRHAEFLSKLPKIAMRMYVLRQRRVKEAMEPSCDLLTTRDTSLKNDMFENIMYVYRKR